MGNLGFVRSTAPRTGFHDAGIGLLGGWDFLFSLGGIQFWSLLAFSFLAYLA
ncbi:hypothetical protein K440DRAFT_31735 [Wilcoxina mikolae CBS 423.85]|nr:hypothetical protein K440DRAFT_31735 [Wilcoxina mikolae CBS 423.85]